LAGLGVNTIVMAGCNFPNCPHSTIYNACNRDLRILLVSDAMPGLSGKGLQELHGIGVVIMASEQIGTWLNP
jgi:nicotinamidase-related amidase